MDRNIEQNPVLVFIHGIGSLGKHFDAIRRALLPVNKLSSVITRPGYDEKNDYVYGSLEKLSELINVKINKLKYKKLILIGHSFGGVLSLLAANQNKRIKAVILISSFFKFKIDLNDLDVSNIAILKNGFFRNTDKRIINNFIKDYKTIDLEAVFKEYSYCQNLDLSVELGKLKIPALIIHSFDDSVVTVRQAYKMLQIIENSSLVLLNECGHNSIIERPKSIANHINEFIKML